MSHGGERGPASVRYIVLRKVDTRTAERHARAVSMMPGVASPTLVIDRRRCYRTLPDLVSPTDYPNAVVIDVCGDSRRAMRRAAHKAARFASRYRISPVWLEAGELERDFGQMFDGVFQPGPQAGGVHGSYPRADVFVRRLQECLG